MQSFIQKGSSQEGDQSSSKTAHIQAKHKPIQAKHKPIQAKHKPIQAKHKPIQAKHKPIQAKHKPIQAKHKPIQAKHKPIQRNTENSNSSEGNTNEAQIKANVSAIMGTDVTHTKVNYNSSKPAQLKAEAYAQGDTVEIGPGGEKHLGHELAHIGQQQQGRVQPTVQANNGAVNINDDPMLEKEADDIGAKAQSMQPTQMKQATKTPASTVPQSQGIIQGYFIGSATVGQDNYRIANDVSVSVKQKDNGTSPYDGTHDMYAQANLIPQANRTLRRSNSGIRLIQTGATRNFQPQHGGATRTLSKIEPRNKDNRDLQGDAMELWADCGKSSAVVMGGRPRKARYNHPTHGIQDTPTTRPAVMKAHMMFEWLEAKDGTLGAAQNTAITQALTQLRQHRIRSTRDVANMRLARKAQEIIHNELNTVGGLVDTMTQDLGVNDRVSPSIGEGYVIDSDYSNGQDPGYQYHWGGVVLESQNRNDKIALENYASGDRHEQNTDWKYQMYGTLQPDQTFHEQHKDANGGDDHGNNPSTMKVVNENTKADIMELEAPADEMMAIDKTTAVQNWWNGNDNRNINTLSSESFNAFKTITTNPMKQNAAAPKLNAFFARLSGNEAFQQLLGCTANQQNTHFANLFDRLDEAWVGKNTYEKTASFTALGVTNQTLRRLVTQLDQEQFKRLKSYLSLNRLRIVYTYRTH